MFKAYVSVNEHNSMVLTLTAPLVMVSTMGAVSVPSHVIFTRIFFALSILLISSQSAEVKPNHLSFLFQPPDTVLLVNVKEAKDLAGKDVSGKSCLKGPSC